MRHTFYRSSKPGTATEPESHPERGVRPWFGRLCGGQHLGISQGDAVDTDRLAAGRRRGSNWAVAGGEPAPAGTAPGGRVGGAHYSLQQRGIGFIEALDGGNASVPLQSAHRLGLCCRPAGRGGPGPGPGPAPRREPTGDHRSGTRETAARSRDCSATKMLVAETRGKLPYGRSRFGLTFNL
jgi:hypothetical protein